MVLLLQLENYYLLADFFDLSVNRNNKMPGFTGINRNKGNTFYPKSYIQIGISVNVGPISRTKGSVITRTETLQPTLRIG